MNLIGDVFMQNVVQTALPQENEESIFLADLAKAIDGALNDGALRLYVECSQQGPKELHVTFSNEISGEKNFTFAAGPDDNAQMLDHAVLKDYILWFTRFGSSELVLGSDRFCKATLTLRGLGQDEPELLSFGHVFPAESAGPEALFQQYESKAMQYYCKKYVRTGHLPHFPEISYQAVFYIEGDKIKTQVNPMLALDGNSSRPGAYSARERYGVWLCKDFVPIERKNEWLVKNLLRITDFHAFFNCQALEVNDAHNAAGDTPEEILKDIESEIKKISTEIAQDEDQSQFEWLIQCVCSGL